MKLSSLLRHAALVSAVTLIPLLVHSQATPGGSLEGTIRDLRSRPVAKAKVTLRLSSAEQRVIVSSEKGDYHFDHLAAGEYEIHVELSGVGESTARCSIDGHTAKQLDLTLDTAKRSATLDFSDDSKFTVSGVTDASSAGSHGSSASAAATEALAKATAALGKESPSGIAERAQQLQQAAERDPASFSANRDAGMAVAHAGRAQEALPYLERASRLEASKPEQANIHHLLGEVHEQMNQPLDAVREFQRAAELDPSEANLFGWGSELLLHRAIGPAMEIFREGHRRYPSSARILLGLAAANYSQATYDEAARYLCAASDLDPNDPTPYLFMGKMLGAQGTKSDAISERLARFATLQPDNAQANYFYAESLWQQHESGKREKVKMLLTKAIRLDPAYSAAYMELGVVYSEAGDLTQGIEAYKKAIALDPQAPEAHYRLALAYKRTGETAKAEEELKLYQQTSSAAALQLDRERQAIQQFIITLQNQSVTAPK